MPRRRTIIIRKKLPPRQRAVRQPIRRTFAGDFWGAWNKAGDVLNDLGDDAYDLV